MTERENIFARIREALTVPAPRPGASHGPLARKGPISPAHSPTGSEREDRHQPVGEVRQESNPLGEVRHWLPPVGHTFEARVELFTRNAAALKADFHLVDNPDQLAGVLVGLRDTEQWQKVGSHAGQLTALAMTKLGLPTCKTDTGYAVKDLETCSVGITECDALIAQTGSVLVTSRSAGGRALSVLPPHHVVLARREQLLADLPEAFALLKRKYGPDYPSFVSFITGPSRTGDIERILVLGAHGPRKLTIICL
jgi:L-lactate dehydrogenase complex protein LldG